MSMFSSARVKRALLSLCVLFPMLAFGSSNNHDARVLWLTLPGSVLKVSPMDGSAALQLAGLKHPGALAVEGDGDTVWVYGQKAITGYDHLGNTLITVNLPSNFHGGSPSGMAVDNTAGTIWIAIQKDLYRLNMGGELQADITLVSNASGASLDPSQSHLWVAEQSGIEVFDASGNRVLNIAQSNTNPPTALAYDADLKQTWVLYSSGIARYDASGNQIISAALASDLGSFVAPDGQGGAWVGGQQNLARLDTSGTAQFVIQPFAGLSGGNALGLVSDAVDHSAWMANSLHLRQFGTSGSFLLEAVLPVGPGNGNGIQQLGYFVDTTPPTVSITTPTNGLWTNKNQLPITLSYSDDTGVDPASVQITSNGSKLAVTCQANSDDSGASCTPNSPLPDGGYSLSITVADYAGNVSKPVTVSFNVLTVPPTITVTSPTSPYTNQPNFTVTGSVNQPGTLTVNGVTISMAADGSFSDAVTLTQGDNPLTFVATDLADNVATITKALNLNTVPPIPVVNGDISVAGPTNGQVTVTGKAGSVAPNVSVTITDAKTGQSVTVTSDATGAFTANLAASSNDSLQITEQDKWGNVTTDPNQIAISNLPPDPASVAPALSTTGFTTFADQTSFLYSGPNPIQTGVAAGSIDPTLVSAIRGKVMDANGNALPGVTITVLSHPEFGQTLSRSDGYFDLAVNGGGTITLNYALKNYLPAQRQLQVPWNVYTTVDTDVVLVQPDPKVTPVAFGATADQIVQGSVVTDARGTRQATVYIPAGTTATMVMPDGSTQPLSVGSFRVTEYTVGSQGLQRMPAGVPTGTAYTYAAELSFDEAAAAGVQTVNFSQPVPVYLNNFLNLPVGYAVPGFYYDHSRGTWIPYGNGDVIKVLSLDSQGNAVLQVDNSGKPATAAELSQLGITTAELGQIARQFAVGSTFWRFALTHFCGVDFNLTKGNSSVPANPHHPNQPPRLCEEKGCDIGVQGQTLGEDIPVVGTPFVLRYDSDRQPGYKPDNKIRVQVTGATIPKDVAFIAVRADVAGETLETTVAPIQPNQIVEFIWDGKDRYGRTVSGQVPAWIHVGYVFSPVDYVMLPALNQNAAGRITVQAPQMPGWAVESDWNAVYTTVGNAAAPPRSGVSGADGWSLSVHHALDPTTRTLYLGDGRTRLGSNITTVVRRIAGGDGGFLPLPALKAHLGVDDLKVASNGDIYFAGGVSEDGYTSLQGIFKIDHATTTVTQVFDSHGSIGAMALAQDGSIYYVTYTTTSNRQQIFRWRPDGTTSLVAGVGVPACPTGANCGPGGPATQALLEWIPKLSVGPDGTLYFLKESAWDGTTSVSAVKTDGTWNYITPIYDNWNRALAAAPDGSVYFGGGWSYGIFQWKPDGSIKPVAGDGMQNVGGDGGPATQAAFIFPTDVAVDRSGAFYINDSGRIRRVGTDGIITTVAGGGINYNYPAPAIGAAGLDGPMALAPDGTIKFARYPGILSVEPAIPGAGPILGSQSLFGYEVTSEDGRELYAFDKSGRHLETIDTATKAALYTFGYDVNGNFISVTDANGRVTTISRDGSGNATSIASPDGQVTTLTVDGNGYLQSVADPAGGTYKMATRADGLLTTFTDPRGNPDKYSYDQLGQLIQNQNAIGGGLTLSRTENLDNFTVTSKSAGGLTKSYGTLNNTDGTQTTINTAADGTVDRTIYSSSADNEASTAADGTITTIQYGADPRFGADVKLPVSTSIKTPSGLTFASSMSRSAPLSNPLDLFSFTSLTDIVNLNGQSYVATFIPATKTWTRTTPVGRMTTSVMDAQNRPLSVQLGNLNAVNYAYDSAGRLTNITAGSGTTARTTQYSYYASGPSQGYLQQAIDTLGRTVGYQYDNAGRLSVETLPDGRQIQFGYDASGNLASLTPPSRPVHAFGYDGINEVQDYAPPNVAGVTNPGTHYAYNLDRQLTQVTRPDGQTIGLGYDTGGRLSTVTIPSGAFQYSYAPAKGQLQGIVAPNGESIAYTWDGRLSTGITWAGPVVGSITRTFDNNFRVTALSVNGSAVIYSYDNDGLLTGAGSETVKHDPANGLVSGTTLGTVATTETYDGFGAPKTDAVNAGSTALYSVTYSRDNAGRITSKAETINGANHSYSYGYNLQGRLNLVTMDGVQSSYDYDANGNRTSISGTVVASYDDQDRLLSYGSNSYTYTANGELLTKMDGTSTASYTYDVLGNLLEVKLPNGNDVQYTIDGQDRRIGKTVNGVLTQGFLYDGQLHPVAMLDGSGNLVERFVYGTRPNVPDYIVKGSNTYRVVTDQLGSPRLIVDDSTGSVIEQIDYDAFGNVVNDTNPGFQPFGFAGGLYDRDTGLVHFGARDYDPQTGRWTEKDPILFAGSSPDLYAYAAGDPVNFYDEDGLHWQYSQSTGGVTYVNDGTGETFPAGSAYSGNGAGLNNPNMQDVPNVGPIPVGFYDIGAPQNVVTQDGHLLQYALPLTPWSGNDMNGRSGFYWHGPKRDDAKKTSSNGCLVSDRSLRELVASMRDGATDNILEVVP